MHETSVGLCCGAMLAAALGAGAAALALGVLALLWPSFARSPARVALLRALGAGALLVCSSAHAPRAPRLLTPAGVHAERAQLWELHVTQGARPAAREAAFRARALAARDGPAHPWVEQHSLPVVVHGAPSAWIVQRGDRLWLWARRAETPDWRGDLPLRPLAPPTWVGARRSVGRALDGVRIRLERSILTRTREPAAGVLLALVSGTRAQLDPRVRALFADAGAAHVLAVSGLHLGWLAGACFFVARLLLRRILTAGTPPSADQVAACLTLAVVAGFVVLTGASASAQRAGWMAACLLSARALERPARAADALAFAVTALLVTDPSLIEDLGAQLSVSATAGLVAMPRRAGGWLSGAWSAAWVASAWTALPLAWHFGVIPLAAPLSSLVLVPPLALVALPASVVGASLDALSLPGASLSLRLAEAAVGLTIRLAELGRGALTIAWVPGRPQLIGALGYGLIACASTRRARRALLGWTLAGALLVVVDLGLRCESGRVDTLEIPAGNARVTLVTMPDGERVLVDVGGSPRCDGRVFRYDVLPALRRSGVARVDALLITSQHHAHAGDLAAASAALGAPLTLALHRARRRGGLTLSSGALHWAPRSGVSHSAAPQSASPSAWQIVACGDTCVSLHGASPPHVTSRTPRPALLTLRGRARCLWRRLSALHRAPPWVGRVSR